MTKTIPQFALEDIRKMAEAILDECHEYNNNGHDYCRWCCGDTTTYEPGRTYRDYKHTPTCISLIARDCLTGLEPSQ